MVSPPVSKSRKVNVVQACRCVCNCVYNSTVIIDSVDFTIIFWPHLPDAISVELFYFRRNTTSVQLNENKFSVCFNYKHH